MDTSHIPLATSMRPQNPDALVGQEHLLAPGKPLYAALHQGALHSMVLWGPPGCGKTTIAMLLGQQPGWQKVAVSAVNTSVRDIKAVAEQAQALQQHQQRLLLFIDEIHRFNKAQQDSLLHMIEQGIVVLVGATTENPSFSINNALLSRLTVYVLHAIDTQQLTQLAKKAINWFVQHHRQLSCDTEAINVAVASSDGDARRLLNILHLAFFGENQHIRREDMAKAISTNWRAYDKKGDIHYDLISALHKSVRGSDPDAALYWLYRMLDGGVDPRYLARRLIRIASEDVGNADPRALQICVNAADAYERLGSPEGELALAQATTYLACTYKSNAVYMASKQAINQVQQNGALEVPMHLRNAPTKLMQNLGYGKEYKYAHDYPDAFVPNEHYLPDTLQNWTCYQPVNRGVEAHFADRLRRWRTLQNKPKIA